MKLVIQIPCYNEEECLPITLKDIPESFPGIDEFEILIIDDGSTDKTIEVTRSLGIKNFVINGRNLGLAKAFSKGLSRCLELNADIIVNLDGDNQYLAKDIEKLITPIIRNKVDIVIGARPNQNILDATSGFRAFSREAALKINVFSNYTYTLEIIIQASNIGLKIDSVPIRTNDSKLRSSRLIKSTFLYTQRAIICLLRALITYKPLKFFSTVSLAFLVPGIIFLIRYLYYYILEIYGHIPSIVIASFLITFSLIIFIVGIFSHLISINRRILEDNQYN